MGLTVSLSLRIKTSDKKRKYCKPAWTGKRKDRLLPLYAEIDGKAVWHPEGIYCLRFEVNGRRQWETIGKNPDEALDRLAERQRWLRQASRQTQPESLTPPPKPSYLLKEAPQRYLSNIANLKSTKTANAYRYALEQFGQVCHKERLDQIDHQDLYNFAKWLRERGLGDRTVHNRIGQVVTFLRAHDIKDVTISYKFTEKKVKAYREAELKALFEVCPDEEWITYQFFLGTGFREQEVSHACYNDIDWDGKTIMVRENRQLGFKPKDREERIVPVSDDLLELLTARRDMHPTDWVIFPGPTGKPQGHFLRMLKERAHAAGLNCGHCINRKGLSCKDHPVCERWILHRFRKSFATFHHENGVSARTIQGWLGHSSLDTTLRYLADAELGSIRTRHQVNSSFAIFRKEDAERLNP